MNGKEKRKILNSFTEIENRVQELEKELKNVQMRETSTNPKINNISQNNASEPPNRTEQLIELIVDERDKLTLIQYRIMAAICKLPNITERRIIQLKYIGEPQGVYHKTIPLWKIANKLGYSVDRINHMHGDALLHLEL